MNLGVEATTVQRILRHSSISTTTGIYMDVIERVRRDAVAGRTGCSGTSGDCRQNLSSPARKPGKNVEPPGGIEPPTFSLRVKRSTD